MERKKTMNKPSKTLLTSTITDPTILEDREIALSLASSICVSIYALDFLNVSEKENFCSCCSMRVLRVKDCGVYIDPSINKSLGSGLMHLVLIRVPLSLHRN